MLVRSTVRRASRRPLLRALPAGLLGLCAATALVVQGHSASPVAAAFVSRGADSGPVGTLPVPAGFPSATDTGVPAGTALQERDGDLKITVAGTLITGALIEGCLQISAPDVTITDSLVVCDQKKAAVSMSGRTTGTTLTDIEIDGADVALVGLQGKGFTATGVNIHDAGDGVHLGGGSTLQNSYVHDLSQQTGLHHDDLQTVQGTSGVGILVLGNTLQDMSASFDGNSVYHLGSGDIQNVLVQGNYLDGGAYTVQVANTPGQANIVITRNQIGRDYRFGIINQNAPVFGAVSFTKNVWQDNGKPATEGLAVGHGKSAPITAGR